MSGYDPTSQRAPIVTDIERQWAADQRPADWDDEVLPWAQHVAEQAERFENYYGHDRKTGAEWGGLWRRVWWPKADPAILHPQVAAHVRHPFVKPGHPRWDAALAAMTDRERAIARRFGVAQFHRDDPRARVLA
jgi:hypothetical protein